MTVPSPHRFGSVANPSINHSLIDPFESTVAAKRMSENVPTSDYFPLTVLKRAFEVIAGFVLGNRVWRFPAFAAMHDVMLAEEKSAAGMCG